MFAGVTLEQFNQLLIRNSYANVQRCLISTARGFGAAALVDHAEFSYGVELTQADAERFIELLTKQVYPELGLYLSEDTTGVLAAALRGCRAAAGYLAAAVPRRHAA